MKAAGAQSIAWQNPWMSWRANGRSSWDSGGHGRVCKGEEHEKRLLEEVRQGWRKGPSLHMQGLLSTWGRKTKP